LSADANLMKPSSLFRRVLMGAFYAAALICFVHYLGGVDWTELQRIRVEPIFLILALPISMGTRFLLSAVWMSLIRQYGEDVPHFFQLNYVYAASWLGRYIPGNVAWVASKVFLAGQHGIRKGVLGVTAVIEVGVQLLSALALAFVLLGISGRFSHVNPDIRVLAGIAFFGILLILIPPIFNRCISAVMRLIKRKDLSHTYHLGNRTFFKFLSQYCVIHLLGCLPYYLLVRSVWPVIGLDELAFLSGVHLLAGALGALAVFAPGGLGVREGVQVILLAPVLPDEIVLVVIVLARVWAMCLDLLFFLISLALVSRKSNLGQPQGQSILRVGRREPHLVPRDGPRHHRSVG
jgi:glycosyltransferase 2 family protein